MRAVVIIPALNEESSIGRVLEEIPSQLVSGVVVVDNGSTDQTAKRARALGATVVEEPERGYGAACLRGIQEAERLNADILVFIDGDYSDFPAQMDRILTPIRRDGYDLVIGSRMRGNLQPGAMLPQARFGNWLAGTLMRWGWGANFTDLGPFRAIRYAEYKRLQMADRNYGWTVEMQLKAVEANLKCTEVPVDYRPRIGQSKVTGTLSGTLNASVKILRILGQYWLTKGNRQYPPA
ncbi:MAG: glycosyltransferase involved in cell wall biosynthesis [Rhodothermales bacterium]|jgi:glycosyltransferase involved in cell wall biosynthesis